MAKAAALEGPPLASDHTFCVCVREGGEGWWWTLAKKVEMSEHNKMGMATAWGTPLWRRPTEYIVGSGISRQKEWKAENKNKIFLKRVPKERGKALSEYICLVRWKGWGVNWTVELHGGLGQVADCGILARRFTKCSARVSVGLAGTRLLVSHNAGVSTWLPQRVLANWTKQIPLFDTGRLASRLAVLSGDRWPLTPVWQGTDRGQKSCPSPRAACGLWGRRGSVVGSSQTVGPITGDYFTAQARVEGLTWHRQ